MEKAQHTPAWEADQIGHEVYETERMTVICTLPLAVGDSAIADRLQRARLIAAAPELLEALKKISEHPMTGQYAAAVSREAIAKAEGK